MAYWQSNMTFNGILTIKRDILNAATWPESWTFIDTIISEFGTYGEVKGVYAVDESGTHVIVSYQEESSTQAALKELDGHPCSDLGGRSLHIRYSAQSLGKCDFVLPVKGNDTNAVSTSASDLNIPGVYLVHDFVTAKEEEVKDNLWNYFQRWIVRHGNILPKEEFSITDKES
ncbi:unnamed protein product [Fraxinus pennsylvanica]|uniref:RRM domain-containing protein n=1 Tax=Fraxinus pennsylvanica TaxID=56036 RepID=A0AAD2ABG4_9LAMI|nr:unnamed protein product [Fraxinus pennsylvanica]